MKFDIFTLTLGRDFYLDKNLKSVSRNLHDECDIVHHVVLQGCDSSIDFSSFENENYKIVVHKLEKNIGAGMGNNYIKDFLRDGAIVQKMDDDCEIVSNDYFKTLKSFLSYMPEYFSVSPYPVGLINNPGGAKRVAEQTVVYDEHLDIYFTVRPVTHVGGFARINPVKMFKMFNWLNDLSSQNSGSEDVQMSHYCSINKIPMLYLENALIVEHMESTLGQHKRYGEDYFKGRF